MANVFRTYKTKKDPETRERVYALDRKGEKIPHPRWRFEYIDWQGIRRKGTGTTSKVGTEKLANQIQAKEDEIRKGYRPAPKSAEKLALHPISEVIEEYLAWGNSQGGRGGRPWGKDHARKRKDHLDWWLDQLNLETLNDLNGVLPKVEANLRELQKAGKAGKTIQNYRESICAFCNWCTNRGYLTDDPLRHSESYDTTPKTKRRAMTIDEIKKLLQKCRPQWKLLYETAICTGLRAKELRSLTVGHLNIEMGGLVLDAEWTKNRKPGFQPLPSELLKRLFDSIQGKSIGDPLLDVPDKPVTVLERDLERAGIKKKVPGGKVDFHSLRTAYVNLVLESGASLKEAMDLSRHSTPDMTINVYGRSRIGRRSELTERVGKAIIKDSDNLTSPQPEVECLETSCNHTEKMVRGGGLEPPENKREFRTKPCQFPYGNRQNQHRI